MIIFGKRAEKRSKYLVKLHRSFAPANLTKFNTRTMVAIQLSLVPLSLVFMRFKPYAVLA